MKPFNDLYETLLTAPAIAPRGMKTREMLLASLEFTPDESFISHPKFPDNSAYVRVELKWYMTGKFQDTSIAESAKIWRDHISNGLLWSNYGGWLWGNGYTYQGFLNAVRMMNQDRDTRRAVAYIGANDLVTIHNKDVPCTNVMQFIIRDDKLITRVWMRSQDAYFGLRNDLPAFWFFTKVFARLTNSDPFALKLDVGSLHVYERHVSRIAAAVQDPEDIQLTSFDYGSMIDEFAKELKDRL